MATGTGRGSELGTRTTPVTSRPPERLSTETKHSFKTTEFFAFVAMTAGILISAAVINGGDSGGDEFIARNAWLYVTILTVGYLVSRGLAKSGSREPYWGGGSNESRFSRDRDDA